MKKDHTPVSKELIWIGLALLVTLFLAWFAFSWTITESTIDIHLHDTYLIFSAWHIILPLFLLITFLLYTIKERFHNYTRSRPRLIITLSGLSLIICIAILQNQFSRLALNAGWTVPRGNTTAFNPMATQIINGFKFAQVLILAAVIFLRYRWKRHRKGEK